MALDGAALGAMIKSQLQASDPTTSNPDELTNFANALGAAIVNYIVANSVVTITQALVTSGSGAGGMVTGVGKLS